MKQLRETAHVGVRLRLTPTYMGCFKSSNDSIVITKATKSWLHARQTRLFIGRLNNSQFFSAYITKGEGDAQYLPYKLVQRRHSAFDQGRHKQTQNGGDCSTDDKYRCFLAGTNPPKFGLARMALPGRNIRPEQLGLYLELLLADWAFCLKVIEKSHNDLLMKHG
ncbi:MAG: hypothetical protein LBE22_12435 [Azoarcus sp.]|nr:hypothetical protein [Azoarcus sp.]